jgi:hypothetical protein
MAQTAVLGGLVDTAETDWNLVSRAYAQRQLR